MAVFYYTCTVGHLATLWQVWVWRLYTCQLPVSSWLSTVMAWHAALLLHLLGTGTEHIMQHVEFGSGMVNTLWNKWEKMYLPHWGLVEVVATAAANTFPMKLMCKQIFKFFLWHSPGLLNRSDERAASIKEQYWKKDYRGGWMLTSDIWLPEDRHCILNRVGEILENGFWEGNRSPTVVFIIFFKERKFFQPLRSWEAFKGLC